MSNRLPPIAQWVYSSTAAYQGRYSISLAQVGIRAPRSYASVALEYVGPVDGREALWDVYLCGTLPSDPKEPTHAVPRAVVAYGPALGLREAVDRAERQLAADLAPRQATAAPKRLPSKPVPKAATRRPVTAHGRNAAKANGLRFIPLSPGLGTACGKAPRRK